MESGVANYQSYPQAVPAMAPPPSGQVTSSTKVLNLSRPGGPPSPGDYQQQQQAFGGQQAYPTQPQVYTVGTSPGQQYQPQQQQYSQVTNVGQAGQPYQQVYSVGPTQQLQPQQYQPQQNMVMVGSSQQPTYRVITTPGQDPTGRTVIHTGAGGQQPTYINQQQQQYQQPPPATTQPTTYQVYPQPNAQQYQTYPSMESKPQPAQYQMIQQQQPIQHQQQQQQFAQRAIPAGPQQAQQPQQVMYAHPAETVQRFPSPQQVPHPPQLARPQQQFFQQSSPAQGTVIIPSQSANQQMPTGQPISAQQWQPTLAGSYIGQPTSPGQPADTYAYAVQQQQHPPPPPPVLQTHQSGAPTHATYVAHPQQTHSAYQQHGQPERATYVAQQLQTSQVFPQLATAPQPQQAGVPQDRPPVSPAAQEVRRRQPTAGSPTRSIKVRSLPMRNSVSVDNVDSAGPPQFVQQPVAQVTVHEGDPTTLTARVRPAGDGSLHVEWYKNGKPLPASSRFNAIFDRGYAVLDFLYTNEEDTGEYSCVATNSQGQDQSGGCRVTIIPEERVVTDSQLPEESMIANLAALEDQMMQNGLSRQSRYNDEPRATRPPTFLKPLAPQMGLRESAPAHFETLLEPTNDPSLSVEWFKDGKAVSMGCRFNAIMDRGFAVLDILYCYPEDNGAYWCVAKNSLGQVQSNVVELNCTPGERIVTSSVLSKDSINYLESLDNWGSDQMAGYDTINVTEEEAPSAPVFDVPPKPVTVTEGGPARLMVKAGGYPRPKVYWYIDGELLASQGGGGNWRIYQDGGISHLEFHRVGNPGQQHVRAVAKNSLGEVSADTVLNIEPQLDYRPDLRHIEMGNPFKRLVQLKKVDRTTELSSAFQKPRAQALDLRRMEKLSEQKARHIAGTEALEAENLYTRVQSMLRTSRRSSLGPPTTHHHQQQPQQHQFQQQQQQEHRPFQPRTTPPAQKIAEPQVVAPSRPLQQVQHMPPTPVQAPPQQHQVLPPAQQHQVVPPQPPPPQQQVVQPEPPISPPAPETAIPPVPPMPQAMSASGQMVDPSTYTSLTEQVHNEIDAEFTIEL